MKRRAFAALAPLALLPRIARAQNAAVRVITPPVDTAVNVFVAKELGLFAKHGLEVDIQPGTNGSAMATAVVSGAVDVGYSDLVTLAKAYLKGIAFVAIAPAALWTAAAPTAALLVLNTSAVNAAKDLVARQFLQSAWFTTAGWAAAHPDAVRRFADTLREASFWANQRANRARSGEFLAKYAKLDPATIASMERAQFAERLTPALIQPAIDVSAKYGGFATFPADRIVYR